MAQEDFQRLQALQAEIEKDPAKLTLELPECRRLMNNFHMKLIGFHVEVTPNEDETMRRIIEEINKRKIGDIITFTREKYSERLLGMTPPEHYQDIRETIRIAGYDPDLLKAEIEQSWGTGEKMSDELYTKMIAVYQQLRQKGYNHYELAG